MAASSSSRIYKQGGISMKINNSADSSVSGVWQNPGARLYDALMGQDNYMSLLNEAYLTGPKEEIHNTESDRTSFSASGFGYPHHVIRNGQLVIHRAGLRAAYSRAAQQGIVSGEVEEHLKRHYRELDWYEESNISDENGEINHAATDDSDWAANKIDSIFVRGHNNIVQSINSAILELNDRQKGRSIKIQVHGSRLSASNAISQSYLQEFETTYSNTINNQNASRDWDKSPSGNYRVLFSLTNNGVNWRITTTSRATSSQVSLPTNGRVISISINQLFDIVDGKIRDTNPISQSVTHSDKVEDFLTHHGILGMRWGIRRPRGADGTVNQSARGKPTDEYLRAKELRQKAGGRGAPNLSNAELKDLNQRLQLEQQFRDLTAKDISAGRSVLNKVGSKVFNKVVDTALTETTKAGLEAIGLRGKK